jgi:hypothetical protein
VDSRFDDYVYLTSLGTIILGYNSSHTQPLLGHESLTVVCILHVWPSGILSYYSSPDFTSELTAEQKLTVGNQPARSLLASSPAGTHGHVFVQCQDFCLFFSSFVVPPLIKREGLDFFYNWCSLTTPYSTRGHIKVGDIYILYIIHITQTNTKFYYILSKLQHSADLGLSLYSLGGGGTQQKTPPPTVLLLLS